MTPPLPSVLCLVAQGGRQIHFYASVFSGIEDMFHVGVKADGRGEFPAWWDLEYSNVSLLGWIFESYVSSGNGLWVGGWWFDAQQQSKLADWLLDIELEWLP